LAPIETPGVKVRGFFYFNLVFIHFNYIYYYMGYFKYDDEGKKLLRNNLILSIASRWEIQNANDVMKEMMLVGFLKHLEAQSKEKEDYELTELIKDIFNNNEYKIYGKL